MDVIEREAHPGPNVPPYRTFEEKAHAARTYQEVEDIPWPVLVDDLRGTTHQVYGGLADPTYLIGTDGRVAFYLHWTHAPTLNDALRQLAAQGGAGIVRDGADRVPHLTAAMTDGWRGIRRGTPQSVLDMETTVPGSAAGLWLGFQLKPLLGRVTLRDTSLPSPARAALVGTVALGGALLLTRMLRLRHDE